MNITDVMNGQMVKLELQSTDKESVIAELATLMEANGKLNDKAAYIQAVVDREKVFSTAIGMGIAIPHGKTNAVNEPALVFGRSKAGIDYGAADGTLSHLFFMIAAPENSNDDHLRLLGQISRKLMYEAARQQLMNAETVEEVIKALE